MGEGCALGRAPVVFFSRGSKIVQVREAGDLCGVSGEALNFGGLMQIGFDGVWCTHAYRRRI